MVKLSLKDIDNAVKKASEVLHGRATGKVTKTFSLNRAMEYASVTFKYKNIVHNAHFYRFKGKKNWLFSDMMTDNWVVA